jgi:enoyl-CoA hydratase/carnithine racemase
MLFYDMRIASERARFATVFAHRGLVAEHGTAWLLPRLIGSANACDLLFSGRTIDAEEALRIGLVNRVVAHGSLLRTVREIASQLAARCSPRSLRIMKRQIYEGYFTDLDTAVRVADQEMVASFTTEDFREGVGSFVQRRPPRFTGR